MPRLCPLLVAVLVSVGCSLPATTFDAYEDKAIHAAEDVLSQARTAVLAADLARRDRTFPVSVAVQLEEAETAAVGANDEFAAILPPDQRSEALRRELLPLLEDAADLIARMRFEARRGDVTALVGLADTLAEPADRIDAWVASHG